MRSYRKFRFLTIVLIGVMIVLAACTPKQASDSPEKPEFNITELEKTDFKYTFKDVFSGNSYLETGPWLDSASKTVIPVIYVGFTDGIPYDEAHVRDMFCGEYAPDECLRSVSSYFKVNSYGRDLFDFRFYYYDTGMTDLEGWHYVNDEDERGWFVGNDFLMEIYEQVKAQHPEEFDAIDTDRDGLIDSVIFLVGDDDIVMEEDGKTRHYSIYGASCATNDYEISKPQVGNPTVVHFVKMPFWYMNIPLEKGGTGYEEYTRMCIHEIGHLFGMQDFYDFYWDDETPKVSSLGQFDMHCEAVGDINMLSKMEMGWISPYVITEDTESITLKIGSSSVNDDVILIPTSKGWNGTPYDEYILVDVLAPKGAVGFDWKVLTDTEDRYKKHKEETRQGGVRIFHVDSRLELYDIETKTYSHIENLEDAIMLTKEKKADIVKMNYNTNNLEPNVPGDSNFWHLIEILPSDGSDKFRLNSDPPSWAICSLLRTSDLFGPGDVFSVEEYGDTIPEGTKMNNGGTFDYTIKVEDYNPETAEAIITITKIS